MKDAAPFDEEDWERTVARLRKAKLISTPQHYNETFLDAHPLVREYFANQVQTQMPQAWHEAQLRLVKHIARQAARITDLSKLDHFLGQLPVANRQIAENVSHVRELAHEISQLQKQLNLLHQPILRIPKARLLLSAIDSFKAQLFQVDGPLSSELQIAVMNWRDIALLQLEVAEKLSTNGLPAQVFRAGDPVDLEREAFVPRITIIKKLKRVVLADLGKGILLYGRRRMGVSTTLRNLTTFLPSSSLVALISMQNPRAFSSEESWIDYMYQYLNNALSSEVPFRSRPLDSRGFIDFLAESNDILKRESQRLVIALDEYEYLDLMVNKGVIGEDILLAIHESIIAHNSLTWILAGNHHFSELLSEIWGKIADKIEMIEVNEFTFDETRQLLTTPFSMSQLWRNMNSNAPRFETNFWGDRGIEHIHLQAGGWPHLVQLIAEITIDLVNDQNVRHVTPQILESALAKAIVCGDIVLYQLLKGESRLPGEWEYLTGFSNVEMQPPPEDEVLRRSLQHRRLVGEEEGSWRLRVPLMQRWIRERG